jgi:hypothetical protein
MTIMGIHENHYVTGVSYPAANHQFQSGFSKTPDLNEVWFSELESIFFEEPESDFQFHFDVWNWDWDRFNWSF